MLDESPMFLLRSGSASSRVTKSKLFPAFKRNKYVESIFPHILMSSRARLAMACAKAQRCHCGQVLWCFCALWLVNFCYFFSQNTVVRLHNSSWSNICRQFRSDLWLLQPFGACWTSEASLLKLLSWSRNALMAIASGSKMEKAGLKTLLKAFCSTFAVGLVGLNGSWFIGPGFHVYELD